MGLMGSFGGSFGENAAAKGISCDSISVLIHFSVILYIIYHGIDDCVILAHKSKNFTCIFPHFIKNCMLETRYLSKSPICQPDL